MIAAASHAMISPVGAAVHAGAAAGALALALSLLLRREQSLPSLMLVTALLMTAAWAGCAAMAVRFGGAALEWLGLLETLRAFAWIAFLITLLAKSWRARAGVSMSLLIAIGLGFIFAFQVLIDGAYAAGLIDVPAASYPLLAMAALTARLASAIGGLVLVHNVYLNAVPVHRWGIRLMCIAIGGLFAYDLNLYTLAALTGAPSAALLSARGLITLLVLPLLALSAHRNRLWNVNVQLSRTLMFHSLSLVAIGVYLVLMALAAYGLRWVGGGWVDLLQVSLLFAMAVLAVAVLLSGRFRAWLKVMVNKHFFAYRYDYREEWLRFIATLSGRGGAGGPLPERVIQAVCDIVESPGGALWLSQPDGRFAPAARWNLVRREGVPGEPAGSPLLHYLAQRERIVDLNELRAGQGDYEGLDVPDWAAGAADAWLLVPLIHQGQLIGMLEIGQPRAARTLNWEDYDLLKTVGRQAASYLAERSAESALTEARKFEEFNRRFAFIMHDLKNLVSQLSLVARNAERHAGNPEFQRDMLATISNSVAKMNDLLARLREHHVPTRSAETVDLQALVARVVANRQQSYALLTFSSDSAETSVLFQLSGHAGQLEQVLEHLIQNAIDASQAHTPIAVRLYRAGADGIIEVADQGIGMTEAFIRETLFQPFRSTKADGFGIGVYEARDIVQAHGGTLGVASTPGAGTTFTIRLPLLADSAAADTAAVPATIAPMGTQVMAGSEA